MMVVLNRENLDIPECCAECDARIDHCFPYEYQCRFTKEKVLRWGNLLFDIKTMRMSKCPYTGINKEGRDAG